MHLKHSLKFEDLYAQQGLAILDNAFIAELAKDDAALYHNLMLARSSSSALDSKLIIELAQYLEGFITSLFGIHVAIDEARSTHAALDNLIQCRRLFVQRKVAKQALVAESDILAVIDDSQLALIQAGLDLEDESQFAQKVMDWQCDEDQVMLAHAQTYASWALFTDAGRRKHGKGLLFQLPKKLDYEHLIDLQINTKTGAQESGSEMRNRNGFELNDEGMKLDKALVHANYCIYCHNQNKDSCSHGLMDKNTAQIAINPLGIKLDGCPLDEKISEMNYLKAQTFVIAPLAIAMIDNPMLAATGHRICNDCMRSCIYQKQEPVDIPFVETQTLHDVLRLPWGFEIYSLLSRWNPLKLDYLPKPIGQYKALVVGLGPAGFTLAHYLLNEGVNVIAIDGLKIEPLDSIISGIDVNGNRVPFKPIRDVHKIYENLNERTSAGFGGVAEYGITVRWDKNYLKIIRLLLERRQHFRMYGSTRFGSGLTYNKSKELGFDHIALAVGAGKPNIPNIHNILAKGVRTASDFLMSLQLSGASKSTSLNNLQIELPIVVIGGGLTALDAATESLNYYAAQVEKLLQDYEKLGSSLLIGFTKQELKLAQTFLQHAKELRQYPEQKTILLKQWGGASIAYRKDLNSSPSYRLNHEEVTKAFEEGIQFLENITPLGIAVDADGHCSGLEHKKGFIPARTILIATGTKPNTMAAIEDHEHFELNEQYFRLSENGGVLLHDSYMSCFGDAHPLYAGNVVKAMASAKYGYKQVVRAIDKNPPLANLTTQQFISKLDELLIARIEYIERLTPNIIEIVIKAPLAALSFEPGQFYRFQNYEANALHIDGKVLAIEGLALTGAIVNPVAGLLSFIILEMGASSALCSHLKKGEIVSLMGPTGTPTEIPKSENVMLVGGGLGNAVLLSIGKALRNSGCQVLYFAGYKKAMDRYKQEEIEDAADIVVWCCDEEILDKARGADYSFHANMIEAFQLYSKQQNAPLLLSSIDRMIAIGSDAMMAAVSHAKNHQLKHLFKKDIRAFASINSPMQCMMKEICAQCLQKHVDPETGAESYVYSCATQDQDMNTVSFSFLTDRLKQNSLLEKTAFSYVSSLKL